MSKLEKGIEVLHIENGRLKRGVIQTIYDTLNIAVVSFEDGSFGKINISDLAISARSKVKPEPKQEEKPVEKSEITITPEEFKKTVIETATKVAMSGKFDEAHLITAIGALLHKELFFDAVKND